ncbi:hypothetical protein [Streptomyces scabiei]|nr:hypothetical protein [Streptomyces scabiei]MDX3279071.1 hypothetical protein [Streptomyces scabiei]MDX3279076.1 hypothetical protein [Streptomyces scabiei]
MTGIEFREGHGDPAAWDDDEYEAYFAWTAPQNPPTSADYQPVA